MTTQASVILPSDFKLELLNEVAKTLEMHVLYLGNLNFEFVPYGAGSEVLNVEEKPAQKAAEIEPKKDALQNVYPLPLKARPRKNSIFRKPRMPFFDGPGAA